MKVHRQSGDRTRGRETDVVGSKDVGMNVGSRRTAALDAEALGLANVAQAALLALVLRQLGLLLLALAAPRLERPGGHLESRGKISG